MLKMIKYMAGLATGVCVVVAVLFAGPGCTTIQKLKCPCCGDEIEITVKGCINHDIKLSRVGQPPPPPPTAAQLKEVVERGMLSLVEAQWTYFAHMKQREKFAGSIREMGRRGGPDGFGAVTVGDVWNADYDHRDGDGAKPYLGYWLKVSAVQNEGAGETDGFAVFAIPANGAPNWPAFVTHIKDAKGGSFAMYASDTWQVNSADLGGLPAKERLTPNDLAALEKGKSKTIKEFQFQ